MRESRPPVCYDISKFKTANEKVIQPTKQWRSQTRAYQGLCPTSTFQTLSSPAQQESHDSITNYTRKQIYYSSSSASTSVCMQQIINLSINTLRLTNYIRPLSAYEIYMNAMAHEMHIILKFLKWKQHLLMKTVMTDHVMDTRFELQYKAVTQLK